RVVLRGGNLSASRIDYLLDGVSTQENGQGDEEQEGVRSTKSFEVTRRKCHDDDREEEKETGRGPLQHRASDAEPTRWLICCGTRVSHRTAQTADRRCS